MTKTTYRCCEWDRSATSQVIPSHSATPWIFRCTWWNLFGKSFSIVVYVHFSLSDKKFILLNCAHTFFYALFLEFMRILAFPSKISIPIFQNAHKNRWMETQLVSHDPKDNILICWFGAHKTFLINYRCWIFIYRTDVLLHFIHKIFKEWTFQKYLK